MITTKRTNTSSLVTHIFRHENDVVKRVFLTWEDDRSCFVPDKYANASLWSVLSPWQSTIHRYITPFKHIVLTPSQPVFGCLVFISKVWFRFMVFTTTCSNIPGISWRSVLLVEGIGVPGENQVPVASHWQTISHN